MSNYSIQKNIENVEILRQNILKLPTFCRDFFLGIESRTSPLTRLNYSRDLLIFFNFISNNIVNKDITDIQLSDMENIKTRDIEAFISYVSYYTYNNNVYINNEKAKARKLSSIKSLFKYLFKSDMITKDIVAKVSAPKLHTKNIIRLEVDEVVNLLNEVDNPEHLSQRQQAYNCKVKTRDSAILSLFLGTGIRVSECVGINIEDIDFKNNSFKIVRKGGNQALLFFSDEVKSSLLEYLKDREILLDGTDEKALFISLQKTRLTTRAMENIVKKYSQVATPLKKITPHKLRSTFGTNLYRETGDIYVVAEVLGHKDVNTTKTHYAAMSEDIRRLAATKVKLRKN